MKKGRQSPRARQQAHTEKLLTQKGSLKTESPLKTMIKNYGMQKDYSRMLNRKSVMQEFQRKQKDSQFLKMMAFKQETEAHSKKDFDYFYKEANNNAIIMQASKRNVHQIGNGLQRNRMDPQIRRLMGSECHSYKKPESEQDGDQKFGRVMHMLETQAKGIKQIAKGVNFNLDQQIRRINKDRQPSKPKGHDPSKQKPKSKTVVPAEKQDAIKQIKKEDAAQVRAQIHNFKEKLLAKNQVNKDHYFPEVLNMMVGQRPSYREYEKVISNSEMIDQLSAFLVKKHDLKSETINELCTLLPKVDHYDFADFRNGSLDIEELKLKAMKIDKNTILSRKQLIERGIPEEYFLSGDLIKQQIEEHNHKNGKKTTLEDLQSIPSWVNMTQIHKQVEEQMALRKVKQHEKRMSELSHGVNKRIDEKLMRSRRVSKQDIQQVFHSQAIDRLEELVQGSQLLTVNEDAGGKEGKLNSMLSLQRQSGAASVGTLRRPSLDPAKATSLSGAVSEQKLSIEPSVSKNGKAKQEHKGHQRKILFMKRQEKIQRDNIINLRNIQFLQRMENDQTYKNVTINPDDKLTLQLHQQMVDGYPSSEHESDESEVYVVKSKQDKLRLAKKPRPRDIMFGKKKRDKTMFESLTQPLQPEYLNSGTSYQSKEKPGVDSEETGMSTSLHGGLVGATLQNRHPENEPIATQRVDIKEDPQYKTLQNDRNQGRQKYLTNRVGSTEALIEDQQHLVPLSMNQRPLATINSLSQIDRNLGGIIGLQSQPDLRKDQHHSKQTIGRESSASALGMLHEDTSAKVIGRSAQKNTNSDLQSLSNPTVGIKTVPSKEPAHLRIHSGARAGRKYTLQRNKASVQVTSSKVLDKRSSGFVGSDAASTASRMPESQTHLNSSQPKNQFTSVMSSQGLESMMCEQRPERKSSTFKQIKSSHRNRENSFSVDVSEKFVNYVTNLGIAVNPVFIQKQNQAQLKSSRDRYGLSTGSNFRRNTNIVQSHNQMRLQYQNSDSQMLFTQSGSNLADVLKSDTDHYGTLITDPKQDRVKPRHIASIQSLDTISQQTGSPNMHGQQTHAEDGPGYYQSAAQINRMYVAETQMTRDTLGKKFESQRNSAYIDIHSTAPASQIGHVSSGKNQTSLLNIAESPDLGSKPGRDRDATAPMTRSDKYGTVESGIDFTRPQSMGSDKQMLFTIQQENHQSDMANRAPYQQRVQQHMRGMRARLRSAKVQKNEVKNMGNSAAKHRMTQMKQAATRLPLAVSLICLEQPNDKFSPLANQDMALSPRDDETHKYAFLGSSLDNRDFIMSGQGLPSARHQNTLMAPAGQNNERFTLGDKRFGSLHENSALQSLILEQQAKEDNPELHSPEPDPRAYAAISQQIFYPE